MALVNLSNVKVYATFSKGFRVAEVSTSKDGREFTQRWTIWSETLGVAEGDIVSLTGFLSAKVNDWKDKDGEQRHSVELSLNSPRLATAEQSPAPADEPWATATLVDSEPF